MRQLTPAELRFHLKRGLQQLSQSCLRDLAGAADKRARGLDEAAAVLLARFDRYEVFAPDPIPAHGEPPGKKPY